MKEEVINKLPSAEETDIKNLFSYKKSYIIYIESEERK